MAEHAHRHGALGYRSPDDQYLETPPGSSYEHTDAHVEPVVRFAIWLVVSAIVVVVGVAAMYWLMIRDAEEPASTQEYPLAVNAPQRLPPKPRLQQFPPNELYEFRMKEEAELHSYGWVVKDAGTVRIPIQDAMRLMLERGAYTSRPQNASAPPAQVDMFPSGASSGRVMETRKQ
jgi:hypothetical protein